MNLLQDIIMVNRNVFRKSIQSFKTSWVIVFTGLAYMIIGVFMAITINVLLRGILSILAGIATLIVGSSLISNYLYLLYNIINYDRITVDDFKNGFKYFIRKIYGVFFIAWIGSYFLSIVLNAIGSNAILINRVIGIVILVALNPLPEIIYQRHYSSGDSIKYALGFMEENWLNWLLPNAIFHFILYLITNTLVLGLFTTYLPIGHDIGIRRIGSYILGQTLFSFIMIYRGHLFKILSTSTRRKRMYMNKFYD
ncbi:MAG: hypothetical protein GX329_05735 [Tissierellia bacterium]|nr:hypothetical protein [Tissierellia bacterium]